ncbi:MAG: hypothetical protein WDO71_14910 [Bacteroidota bacterium]
MIIRLPIRFEGSVGEKTLYGLFDTGATFSCIHPDMSHLLLIQRSYSGLSKLQLLMTAFT